MLNLKNFLINFYWSIVAESRTYIYLWLIHVDVWQKPTQYCKASILQLKKILNDKTNK